VGTLCANPQISDVMPNSAMPVTKILRRPKRSARVPVAIKTVVTASVYAFMIHCMPLKSLCKTRSSVGRITGTLEISRPNISDARHIAPSASVFLRIPKTRRVWAASLVEGWVARDVSSAGRVSAATAWSARKRASRRGGAFR
jgi:hypothetical protein